MSVPGMFSSARVCIIPARKWGRDGCIASIVGSDACIFNRRSFLWLKKGRLGGAGAYRGARWHSAKEALALFDDLPVADLRVQSAIHLAGGGRITRWLERKAPASWLTGAFLLVSGRVIR